MNELADLRQRLAEKETILRRMAGEATDDWNLPRLLGKAQGISLAISFIDEALRQHATPGELHEVDDAARRAAACLALSRPMTPEAAAARRLAGDALRDVTGGGR